MQVERRTENWEQIRPDRLRRHPDRGRRERETRRGEEAQFVRAHQRRNIRLGRLLTKQNSTQLDWTWTGVSVLKTGVMNLLMGATTGCHRFKVLSLSLSRYLFYSSLCLSLCLAAPRRFLIEMFCTIFLRITTCCLRATEEPPFHSSPPSLLLHCALPCPFWPSVQRATEQLAK